MSIDPSTFQNYERLLKFAQENPELLKKEYERALQKTKPLKSSEYLAPGFLLELDEEGGVVIEPDTDFVIKAFEKTGEKFFINVVKHAIIDKPEEKELVEFEENETGIRIPMSVGTLKEDFDKKGEPCKVVDVILNPDVCDNVKKNKEMLHFLVQLIITYIFQKFKIELKQNVTFPKLKYKGKSMEFQRVKGKKAPKIQTLNSEELPEANQKSRIRETENIPAMAQRPVWKLYLHYANGTVEEFDGLNEEVGIDTLKYTFEMPLLMTGKNIICEVSEDEMMVRAGKFYEICLKFLLKVDKSTTKAEFDTKTRALSVTVNLQKIQDNKDTEEPAANEGEKVVTKPIKDVNIQNDLLFDLV